MENYTITKLSEIFKTTRSTVYKKFNDTSIIPFLHIDEKGTKTLLPEGFNMFQLLMSNSKVGQKHESIRDLNTKDKNRKHPWENNKNINIEANYTDILIRSLNEQITYFREENTRIQREKADLQQEKDRILQAYMALTEQKLLSGTANNKKKWFWQKK